ncbi:MAG: hypothetical protein K2G30_07810 [Muribaculaceae bacterium]|nr:hypothetical protein [Muribaculaceae bacterium]MDE7143143.1 hypothetical protein [Muribaculaceae bacterium]
MTQQKTYTLEELTGRQPATWAVVLATTGLLGILAGVLLPLLDARFFNGALGWWKYVYAGGALCFLAAKFFTPYTGIHPRIKRLYRIESWSAIFFCVAAFFLFYNGQTTRDSFAFTLAGGALLVFTTIAIPSTTRKELRRAEGKSDHNKRDK